MRIRPATTADIHAIAKLHAESWRVTYRGQYTDTFLDGPVYDDRLSVWRNRLTSPTPNQHTIVAEDSDALLGFACAFGDHDPRWGTLLDNIHVEPTHKGSGIGTELIREIAAWALDAHPSAALHLRVLEANAPARRFYERLGAKNVERTTSNPPGGGAVVSFRYAWPDPCILIAAGNRLIRAPRIDLS
jgi:GNAT superfamily N-acetyltransferase